MVLALGAGDLDQRVGAEPAGIGQHVGGDLDLVVEGEVLDHLERRVVDRRQPPRELGPGAGLDPHDQEAEHVVEHLDLLFGQPLAVMQEQVGHAPERRDAFGRRAAGYGVLEFGNDGMGGLVHLVSLLSLLASLNGLSQRPPYVRVKTGTPNP